MSTLIIILAVVLILGSMLWVLPSPKQRHQMQLRRLAMSEGFTVKLVKIEDQEYPGKTRSCIAYRLMQEHGRNNSQSWMVYRKQPDNDGRTWVLDGKSRQPDTATCDNISHAVAALPDDMLALERTGKVISFYWNEQGEEADISRIKTVLENMAN